MPRGRAPRHAAGERPCAGHFLSVCADVTFTIHPDTGQPAILVEPNAGGWGDPRRRRRGLVLADLRAELITEDTARRIYGLTDEDLTRQQA